MTLWIRTYWVEALLCVAFIFLSTWQLSARPATWFDEGINIGIAKSLVQDSVFSLEVAPGVFVRERPFLITTNYPVILPVALSLELFGFNLTAARLPMVFFLFGFLAAAYLLVRRLYGREAARLSSALVLSFIPLYGNGRAVLGEVPGLFYLLSGLLLLPSGLALRRLFLAGLLFGLAIATKPFFLIILVALATGEWVVHRYSGMLARRLAMLGVGLILPLAGWLYSILPELSLQELSATVSFYANSYASPDVLSLVGQNLVRFFTESTPLHFLVLFLAVALFLWRKRRRGEPLSESEVLLGVFVVLTLFFYLKTPGWYRYFFPAHLPLFLFFPVALVHFFRRSTALAVVAALFLVQSVHLVLQSNDPLYYSRDAAEMAAKIMEQTISGERVLLINKPSVAFLLKDRAVYQYLEINPVLHLGSRVPVGPDGRPVTHIYD